MQNRKLGIRDKVRGKWQIGKWQNAMENETRTCSLLICLLYFALLHTFN